MTDVYKVNDNILIRGQQLSKKQDFFPEPMQSSFLLVFTSKVEKGNKSKDNTYNPDTILCKMVPINRKGQTIFIPLLHTMTNINP